MRNSTVRHVTVTASGLAIGHNEPLRVNDIAHHTGDETAADYRERYVSPEIKRDETPISASDNRYVAMPASGSHYFPARRYIFALLACAVMLASAMPHDASARGAGHASGHTGLHHAPHTPALPHTPKPVNAVHAPHAHKPKLY